MRNKTIMGIFLTLILICASGTVFSITRSFASSGRWYVDPRGEPYGDFRTITETIQSSLVQEGDSVIVNPAIYCERPYINKSLKILALIQGSTIVDGSGMGNIFTIAANNVTLKDITVQNSGDNFAAISVQTGYESSIIVNNTLSNNWYGIYIESSNNNFISNNVIISNSKNYGIYLRGSSNNTISMNTVSNTIINDGLCLENCSDNLVANNQFSANRHGIILSLSQHNTINSNSLSNNRKYGIFLSNSSNNSLSGNTMTNNKYNFGIEGQFLEDFVQTIDDSNKVDTKPICYWVNEHNKFVPAGRGFVGLINCGNITVNGLTLTKNNYGLLLINTNNSKIESLVISNNEEYGIHLWSSHQNEITMNTISTSEQYDCIGLKHSNNNTISRNLVGPNTRDGISLEDCNNNKIEKNTIQNIRYGMYILDSSNNTVDSNSIRQYQDCGVYLKDSVNNILTNNSIVEGRDIYSYGIFLGNSSYNEINMNIMNSIRGWGIWLEASNNSIYHNNFLQNFEHANVLGANLNTWDDNYPSGGNYWDDYTGQDLNGDGIGDSPYVINAQNEDRYPLMNSIHDLAVTNVTLSKVFVKRGESVDINVTIENQGRSIETFDLIVYYNTTTLNTTCVTLESQNSTTICIKWSTGGVAAGNYTIKAYATPVQDEIDSTDNTYVEGTVTVASAGDVTGDGHIDIYDLVWVSSAFGAEYNATDGWYWHKPPYGPCSSCPHDPRLDIYNPPNTPMIIDIYDLIIIAVNFGT